MGEGREAREGGDVQSWLMCLVVWQKPTQHCKSFFFNIFKEKNRVHLWHKTGEVTAATGQFI